MEITTLATLTAWPEKNFGFCDFVYGGETRSAFIHRSVFYQEVPPAGTTLKVTVELDAHPRPKVVRCTVLSEAAQQAIKALAAADQDAPCVLMGWRLGNAAGKILVDERQGSHFHTLEFSTLIQSATELLELGCPERLIVETQQWVEIEEAMELPTYRPADSAVLSGCIGVLIPEIDLPTNEEGTACIFPEHPLLQRLYPAVGYTWSCTEGLNPQWKGTPRCLMVSLSAKDYEEFVLTALEEGWHPYAWGRWGSSDQANWRLLDDPQVCGYLGRPIEALPDLHPPHTRNRPSVDKAVEGKRAAAEGSLPSLAPNLRPNLPYSLERVTHRDIFGNLYGRDQTTMTVTLGRQTEVRVALHTGLKKPCISETLNGPVLYLPINWGFLEASGRYMDVEVYKTDPNVTVLRGVHGTVGADPCGRAVVYGPYGATAEVNFKWFYRNGMWSKSLSSSVRVTFTAEGVKTEYL